MIWIIACVGGPDVDDTVPQAGAYTGESVFTEVHLTCRGEDQEWRIYSRGVGSVVLGLAYDHPRDSDDSSAGHVEEQHDVPLADQDPGGWWAVYALTLQHAGSGTAQTTEVPCSKAEGTWTLWLQSGEEVLDCDGSAC